MTEIQIPYLPSAQFFKILCRLGINEPDIIGDSDSDPQIRTIGGTVSISAMVPRFRYTEADGRKRVVYTKTETYNIETSTGELVDADGNLGVYLLNTNSPQMDPQGWTYKATVRPNGGDPFDAFIPSNPEGGVYDLGDGLVFTPSTGITSLETRVKALEDAGGSGPGGPENFDETVQDIVGAMVAGAGGTYDDAAGTIVLPSGGGGAVSSVAGRTGIVVLSSADLTDAASLATDAELTAGLAGKADTTHGHAIADVTGLQGALDGKQPSGSYAASAHTHTLADVTDYSAPDLYGYVVTTDPRLSDDRDPTAHAHPISDVTGLQSALDGKAATGHTHTAGDITSGTLAAAQLPAASATASGIVELATTAEATTGTDATRAVTPAGLKAVADTKAASTHTHDDRYLQTATAQPINAQTGTTYTLVASDAGKLVTLTNAAAITLTVPGSVFTAGQRVDCLAAGAGMVTAVGSSCTVNGTPSLVSRAQYSAFTVLFTSATTAIVIGDLA